MPSETLDNRTSAIPLSQFRRHFRCSHADQITGPSTDPGLDDLKGTSSDLVRRLGLIGYTAKGLVIVGAGVLVIIAASLSEPDKATGLDGALKTLGAQPYGAILLIVAGLGIIVYGLYSFAMARYTKM